MSRAELDALCSVMTETLELAERTGNAGATPLLRRALALVRDRCPVPDAAGGGFNAC